MNKEEFLQDLKIRLEKKEISRAEILNIVNLTNTGTYKLSLNIVLYILGIIIALIGIVVFLNNIWVDVPSFLRILITLGLGIIFTFNSIFLQRKNKNLLSIVFYFIGGIVNLIGTSVLIYELNKNFILAENTLLVPMLAFGVISLFYLGINYSMKQAVLTFFTLLNLTIFFFMTYFFVLDDNNFIIQDTIFMVFVLIGFIYIILSKYFENTFNKYLIPLTNIFGTIFILGGSISKVEIVFWQFLYILISIGVYSLSLYLKSRWILIINSLFLAGYIIYITNRYFASSLGWPISLIILGFVFIGLGYFSVNLDKRLKMN